MKSWRMDWMFGLVVMLVLAALHCSTRGEETIVPPSHAAAMAIIHNQHRASAGLSAQELDDQLTATAQNWANRMASVGSMYHGGGEQIIAYSGGDHSYEAGFRLWLGSSPHRAWLYSRGDRCGFGYAIGRNGCAYYAGAFSGSAGYSYSQTSYSSNRYRWRRFRRR